MVEGEAQGAILQDPTTPTRPVDTETSQDTMTETGGTAREAQVLVTDTETDMTEEIPERGVQEGTEVMALFFAPFFQLPNSIYANFLLKNTTTGRGQEEGHHHQIREETNTIEPLFICLLFNPTLLSFLISFQKNKGEITKRKR